MTGRARAATWDESSASSTSVIPGSFSHYPDSRLAEVLFASSRLMHCPNMLCENLGESLVRARPQWRIA